MSEPRWSTLLRRLENRATPIIALLLIGLVFFLGIRSERTGFVDDVLDPNLKRITHPVLNAFRGKPPAVTRLDLQLDKEMRDSLIALKDIALTNGWIDAQDNVWLPVQTSLGDRKAAGSMQLRSGPVDRTLVPRWPLVLRIVEADTGAGMQQFDLEPVHDAKPIYGALMRAALEDLGIPVLGWDLVELRSSGRDLGLYTMEGRADSIRLAQWGRGSGPVLRFDDVLHKHAMRSVSDLMFPIDPPVRAEWLSAPVLASRTHLDLSTLEPGIAYRRAVEALESFRAGNAKASAVFDPVALGKFLALCDVLGAQASARWWNLRFLADSTTGKLIVLPQRVISGTPIPSIIARQTDAPITFPSNAYSLTGRFLGDQAIYTEYITWLDKLSEAQWLEDLLEGNKEEIAQLARIVRSEYPDAVLDLSVLEHCRSVVRLMLHPREPALAYTRSMRAKQRTLAVANVHDLPIVVVGFVNDTDTIPFGIPIVIPPREKDKPIAYARIDVEVPEHHGPSVTLVVSLLGSTERHYVTSRTTGMFVATK